ncbi:hypothetical protein [Streptomyces sp. NPDC057428]|uniref:hypothetical protein n=1 Tax=Streptomyces sp. NPDC057428 TaxID=3346129 RepID=UPI0036C603E8
MAEYDVSHIRDLAKQWHENSQNLLGYLGTMHGSVQSMGGAWTGKAAQAAQVVWNGPDMGERDVWNQIWRAAQVAREIGDAIDNYADELQKTIKEINKQHLIDALSSIFGLVLAGMTMGMAGLIEDIATAVGKFVAGLAAGTEQLATVAAGLGVAATWITEAFIDTYLTLVSDIYSQLLAESIVDGPTGIDWESEGINLGLSVWSSFGKNAGEHYVPNGGIKPKPLSAGDGLPNTSPHGTTPSVTPTGTGSLPTPPEIGKALPGAGDFTSFNMNSVIQTDHAPLPGAGVKGPGADAPRYDIGGSSGTTPLPENPHPQSAGPGRNSTATAGSKTTVTDIGGPNPPVRQVANGGGQGSGGQQPNGVRGDGGPASGTPSAFLDSPPRSAVRGADDPAVTSSASHVPGAGTITNGGSGLRGADSPTGGAPSRGGVEAGAAAQATSAPHGGGVRQEAGPKTSGAHRGDAHEEVPPGTAAAQDGGTWETAPPNTVASHSEAVGVAQTAGAGAGAGLGGARGAAPSAHGTGTAHEAASGPGTPARATGVAEGPGARPGGAAPSGTEGRNAADAAGFTRTTGPEPADAARVGRDVPQGAREVSGAGGGAKGMGLPSSAETPGGGRLAAGGHRPAAEPDAGPGRTDGRNTRSETSAPGTPAKAGRTDAGPPAQASDTPGAGPHDIGFGATAGRGGHEGDRSAESAAATSGQDRDRAGHDSGAAAHDAGSAAHGAGSAPVRDDAAGSGVAAPGHQTAHTTPEAAAKSEQWNSFKQWQTEQNRPLVEAEGHLDFQRESLDRAWQQGYDRFARHDLLDGRNLPKDGSQAEHSRWQWRNDITREFRAEIDRTGRVSHEAHGRIVAAAEANAHKYLTRTQELDRFAHQFKEQVDDYRANRFGYGEDLPAFDKAPTNYVYDSTLQTYVKDDAKFYGHPQDNTREETGSTLKYSAESPASADRATDTGASVDHFRDKTHDFNVLEQHYIDKHQELTKIFDEFLNDHENTGGLPASVGHRIDKLQEDAFQDISRLADREHDMRVATGEMFDDVIRWNSRGETLTEDLVHGVRMEFQRDLRADHDLVFAHGDGDGPRALWKLTSDRAIDDLPGRIVKEKFVRSKLAEETEHAEHQLSEHGEDFQKHFGEGGRQRVVAEYLDAVRTHAAGHFTEQVGGGRRSDELASNWTGVRDQLRSTLPDRIRHEGDLQAVVGESAHEFHEIAVHPGSIESLQLYEDTLSRLGNDFRTQRVARYDELFAAEGHKTDAWLSHESHHEDGFQTRFEDLQSGHYISELQDHHYPSFKDWRTDSPATPGKSTTPDRPTVPSRPTAQDADGPAVKAGDDDAQGTKAADTSADHAPRHQEANPGQEQQQRQGGRQGQGQHQTHEQHQVQELATVERRPDEVDHTPGAMAHDGHSGRTVTVRSEDQEQKQESRQADPETPDQHREVRRMLLKNSQFSFTDAQIEHTWQQLLQERPSVANLPVNSQSALIAEALARPERELVGRVSEQLLHETGMYRDGREIHQVHHQLIQQGPEFQELQVAQRAEYVATHMTYHSDLARHVGKVLKQWDVDASHVSYAHDVHVERHGPFAQKKTLEERAAVVAETVLEQLRLTRNVNASLQTHAGGKYTYRQVDQARQQLLQHHGDGLAALDTEQMSAAIASQILRSNPSSPVTDSNVLSQAGVARMTEEAEQAAHGPAVGEETALDQARPGTSVGNSTRDKGKQVDRPEFVEGSSSGAVRNAAAEEKDAFAAAVAEAAEDEPALGALPVETVREAFEIQQIADPPVPGVQQPERWGNLARIASALGEHGEEAAASLAERLAVDGRRAGVFAGGRGGKVRSKGKARPERQAPVDEKERRRFEAFRNELKQLLIRHDPAPEQLHEAIGDFLTDASPERRSARVGMVRRLIDTLPDAEYADASVNVAHKVLNVYDHDRPALAVPGAEFVNAHQVTSGPGRGLINRDVPESVIVDGEAYVPVYMTVVADALGSNEPEYKDFGQDEDGLVRIHTGDTEGSEKVLWVSFGQPLRQVKWLEKYSGDGWNDPMIRSFLVPLRTVNEISRGAITEFESKDAKLDLNVDKHYAANQFGIQNPRSLELLRQTALPGSLRTYTDGATEEQPQSWGDVRPTSELRERLGVPNERMPGFSVFTQEKGFLPADKYEQTARELREISAAHHNNSRLLERGDRIRSRADVEAFFDKHAPVRLKTDLATHDQKRAAVDVFVREHVVPWANQARITQTLHHVYEAHKDPTEAHKDHGFVPAPFAYELAPAGPMLRGLRRTTQLEIGRQHAQDMEMRFGIRQGYQALNGPLAEALSSKEESSRVKAELQRLKVRGHAALEDYPFKIGERAVLSDKIDEYRRLAADMHRAVTHALGGTEPAPPTQRVLDILTGIESGIPHPSLEREDTPPPEEATQAHPESSTTGERRASRSAGPGAEGQAQHVAVEEEPFVRSVNRRLGELGREPVPASQVRAAYRRLLSSRGAVFGRGNIVDQPNAIAEYLAGLGRSRLAAGASKTRTEAPGPPRRKVRSERQTPVGEKELRRFEAFGRELKQLLVRPDVEAAQLNPVMDAYLQSVPAERRGAVVQNVRQLIDTLPDREFADESVNAAHKALDAFDLDRPVLAVPGAEYVSSSEVIGEYGEGFVNRDVPETVVIDGNVYVPVYSAVYADALGSGRPGHKDIGQRDDGLVQIHTGANGPGEETLWVSFGQPLRQVKWVDKYRVDGAAEPMVRSILVPLQTVNEISRSAVTEKNSKGSGLDLNVDKHFASNQYGVVHPWSLELLRRTALPGSLRTYTDGEVEGRPDAWGDVRPMAELRERLGVPNVTMPGFDVFVDREGFLPASRYESTARTLREVVASHFDNPELRESGDLVRSRKAVEEFFDEHAPAYLKENIATQEAKRAAVDRFIHEVVMPWAAQARITQLLHKEFDELRKARPSHSPVDYGLTTATPTLRGQRRTTARRLGSDHAQDMEVRFGIRQGHMELAKPIADAMKTEKTRGKLPAELHKLKLLKDRILKDYPFKVGDRATLVDKNAEYRALTADAHRSITAVLGSAEPTPPLQKALDILTRIVTGTPARTRETENVPPPEAARTRPDGDRNGEREEHAAHASKTQEAPQPGHRAVEPESVQGSSNGAVRSVDETAVGQARVQADTPADHSTEGEGEGKKADRPEFVEGASRDTVRNAGVAEQETGDLGSATEGQPVAGVDAVDTADMPDLLDPQRFRAHTTDSTASDLRSLSRVADVDRMLSEYQRIDENDLVRRADTLDALVGRARAYATTTKNEGRRETVLQLVEQAESRSAAYRRQAGTQERHGEAASGTTTEGVPEPVVADATPPAPARPLRYRERIALAKREWEGTVADAAAQLEQTLLDSGPGARSLVLSAVPDEQLWAMNIAGEVRWLEQETGRITQAPQTASGEEKVMSIDLDPHARLIAPDPRLLAAGDEAVRFCELTLGGDLNHVV